MPDAQDLDLTPFEERLQSCQGNAAIAVRGFYAQDVSALVAEVKRLRGEREALLSRPAMGVATAETQSSLEMKESNAPGLMRSMKGSKG